VRLGRWEEAGRLTDDVLDTPLTGLHRGAALTVRGHLDALRGDAERARHHLDEAEQMQRQAVGASWTAPVAVARSEAALWAGDPLNGRRVVAAELDSYEAADLDASIVAPVLTVGIRAEADLAAVARAKGDAGAETAAVQRAIALLEELRALLSSEHLVASSPPPEAALCGEWGAAESARAAGDDSAAGWRELAERWEVFGSPYPAAYAYWREAEALLAAGGPRADVQLALAAAHAIAIEIGARPLHTQVESLAGRARIVLGGGPEPGAHDGAGNTAERIGLTARELEVLRRLAAGESNREIGRSLYISHKTVSVHVSRILTKLDARTRTEAASLAQRLGLLDEPS
jgi:DNA-binding CsgD family transcriptional regulator